MTDSGPTPFMVKAFIQELDGKVLIWIEFPDGNTLEINEDESIITLTNSLTSTVVLFRRLELGMVITKPGIS